MALQDSSLYGNVLLMRISPLCVLLCVVVLACAVQQLFLCGAAVGYSDGTIGYQRVDGTFGRYAFGNAERRETNMESPPLPDRRQMIDTLRATLRHYGRKEPSMAPRSFVGYHQGHTFHRAEPLDSHALAVEGMQATLSATLTDHTIDALEDLLTALEEEEEEGEENMENMSGGSNGLSHRLPPTPSSSSSAFRSSTLIDHSGAEKTAKSMPSRSEVLGHRQSSGVEASSKEKQRRTDSRLSAAAPAKSASAASIELGADLAGATMDAVDMLIQSLKDTASTAHLSDSAELRAQDAAMMDAADRLESLYLQQDDRVSSSAEGGVGGAEGGVAESIRGGLPPSAHSQPAMAFVQSGRALPELQGEKQTTASWPLPSMRTTATYVTTKADGIPPTTPDEASRSARQTLTDSSGASSPDDSSTFPSEADAAAAFDVLREYMATMHHPNRSVSDAAASSTNPIVQDRVVVAAASLRPPQGSSREVSAGNRQRSSTETGEANAEGAGSGGSATTTSTSTSTSAAVEKKKKKKAKEVHVRQAAEEHTPGSVANSIGAALTGIHGDQEAMVSALESMASLDHDGDDGDDDGDDDDDESSTSELMSKPPFYGADMMAVLLKAAAIAKLAKLKAAAIDVVYSPQAVETANLIRSAATSTSVVAEQTATEARNELMSYLDALTAPDYPPAQKPSEVEEEDDDQEAAASQTQQKGKKKKKKQKSGGGDDDGSTLTAGGGLADSQETENGMTENSQPGTEATLTGVASLWTTMAVIESLAVEKTLKALIVFVQSIVLPKLLIKGKTVAVLFGLFKKLLVLLKKLLEQNSLQSPIAALTLSDVDDGAMAGGALGLAALPSPGNMLASSRRRR